MHRIVPVLVRCLSCAFVVGAVLGGLVLLFNQQLLGIYSADPEVIAYGVKRLSVICLTYYLCGMMDVTCGSIRGMGYAITPTIVSLTGACGLRILWIYTVFKLHHTLFSLYISYPISWAITFLAHLVCFIFFFHHWKKGVLAAEPPEAA